MVYELAGLRVLIKNKCAYTTRFCKDYLSEDQDSPVDITAIVTKEEFEEEKAQSPNFSDGYIENICLYRSICLQMPTFGRILMHSSILEYNGKAYAFLGRSGTGKSTHSKLWLKHIPNVKVVNGDKPILAISKDKFIAYGTPWQGKEGWGTKTQAPLCGLCFLEQAKVNSIRPLSKKELTSRLFTQLLLPDTEEGATATLELADQLIEKTPAFLLGCDISEEAVQKSFEALTGKNYTER